MADRRHLADGLLALGIAGLLTVALFLLLPLSRILSPEPDTDRWVVREVSRVEAPPPPPPRRPPDPAPDPSPPAGPDLDAPPREMPLESLPVRLSVTPDPDLVATPAVADLGRGLDTAEEVRRYTFADLPGGPRVLSVPPVSIPVSLARRGFARGRVVFSIRIEPDGSVEVLDVLESSHPELVAPARRSASRARFEPPEIDGQPVAVEGRWPLIIETDRR